MTAVNGIVWAQTGNLPVYSSEFWFFPEDEPHDIFGDTGFDVPEIIDNAEELTKEKLKELLEEAAFVYSGMLYGFDFIYVPGDMKRGVKESFTLTPIAGIVWGDNALSVGKVRQADEKVFVNLIYRCEERHINWLDYWNTGNLTVIGASAFTKLPERTAIGRKDAVEEAAKLAIRTFMQGRIHNKPKEISGSFVFAEPPRMRYEAGLYNASIKIKLDVKEVENYSIY